MFVTVQFSRPSVRGFRELSKNSHACRTNLGGGRKSTVEPYNYDQLP